MHIHSYLVIVYITYISQVGKCPVWALLSRRTEPRPVRRFFWLASFSFGVGGSKDPEIHRDTASLGKSRWTEIRNVNFVDILSNWNGNSNSAAWTIVKSYAHKHGSPFPSLQPQSCLRSVSFNSGDSISCTLFACLQLFISIYGTSSFDTLTKETAQSSSDMFRQSCKPPEIASLSCLATIITFLSLLFLPILMNSEHYHQSTRTLERFATFQCWENWLPWRVLQKLCTDSVQGCTFGPQPTCSASLASWSGLGNSCYKGRQENWKFWMKNLYKYL